MKANAKATSKNTVSTSATLRKSGLVKPSVSKSGADPKKGAFSSSAKSASGSSPLSTRKDAAQSGLSPRGRQTGRKGRITNVQLGEDWGPGRTDWARVDAMTEEDIAQAIASDPDTFTIDDCDMSTLEVIMPAKKESIHLRIDPDVLAYFRGTGRGYLTRMNGVLRAYANAHQRASGKV